MPHTRLAGRLTLSAAFGLVGLGCSQPSPDAQPQVIGAISAARPARPTPVAMPPRPSGGPPALTGAADIARANVANFITWASASVPTEREAARNAIHAAAKNADVVNALADEAFRAQSIDHSRALIVLSILGEMQSSLGESHLDRFAWQSLPTTGTIVEGDIAEATELATLEAKAVDGLAYLGTATADAEVLRAVSDHASLTVRAEAISAYLWNHNDSPEARAELLKHVRKGEEIYLDRVRRGPGVQASSFNPKLAAFLNQHPEVVPPDPVRVASPRPPKPAHDTTPGTPPSI
jgi:hypothetical protein